MKLTKNYRVINERLTSSGIVPANDLRTLERDGYDVVINLLPDDTPAAVANEQAIIEAQGIEYYYIPVDWQQPTQENFIRFCEVMDLTESYISGENGREFGKPATRSIPSKRHIHCAANYRASAFYAAYAVQKGLWTQAKAKVFIADIWDIADDPVWQAFWEKNVLSK